MTRPKHSLGEIKHTRTSIRVCHDQSLEATEHLQESKRIRPIERNHPLPLHPSALVEFDRIHDNKEAMLGKKTVEPLQAGSHPTS